MRIALEIRRMAHYTSRRLVRLLLRHQRLLRGPGNRPLRIKPLTVAGVVFAATARAPLQPILPRQTSACAGQPCDIGVCDFCEYLDFHLAELRDRFAI
jgi:hypothetical protein